MSIYRDGFIKEEQLYKYIDDVAAEFASRNISAPSKYEYTLLVQSFIKTVAPLIKSLLYSMDMVYVSGMNAVEIGAAIDQEIIS